MTCLFLDHVTRLVTGLGQMQELRWARQTLLRIRGLSLRNKFLTIFGSLVDMNLFQLFLYFKCFLLLKLNCMRNLQRTALKGVAYEEESVFNFDRLFVF
jgi:hypothetical protein